MIQGKILDQVVSACRGRVHVPVQATRERKEALQLCLKLGLPDLKLSRLNTSRRSTLGRCALDSGASVSDALAAGEEAAEALAVARGHGRRPKPVDPGLAPTSIITESALTAQRRRLELQIAAAAKGAAGIDAIDAAAENRWERADAASKIAREYAQLASGLQQQAGDIRIAADARLNPVLTHGGDFVGGGEYEVSVVRKRDGAQIARMYTDGPGGAGAELGRAVSMAVADAQKEWEAGR